MLASIQPIRRVVLIAGIYLSLASQSAELSEQEQLDLLEAAEEYYFSQNRDNAHAIRLFENVLDNVQLANPIRQEIVFRIGAMRLYDRQSIPSDAELIRAAETYERLVSEGEHTDWRVIQSHMYLGDIWNRLRDYELASEQYLFVRELLRGVPPEQRETFPGHMRDLSGTALRNLIQMHERRGLAGLEDLQALADSQSADAEFSKAAAETVNAMRREMSEEFESIAERDLEHLLLDDSRLSSSLMTPERSLPDGNMAVDVTPVVRSDPDFGQVRGRNSSYVIAFAVFWGFVICSIVLVKYSRSGIIAKRRIRKE